jgi:uncharacterized protein (TIGR03437 family)
MRAFLACVTTVLFWASAGRASESDALAISANIQARHMPFGTLLDPIYASPTSQQIVGYTRCGDSALWTGAYLAAESFRYKVTQSADALQNVKSALAGLKALSDLTGDNRLARCMVLASSPYAAGIASEEASNTIHQNPPWIWVDNTSRDQIVGAFFGLGVAFDLVDDPAVKTGVNNLVTLLIGYISRHQWSPNDDITSTFEVRPEELQMLLQVARHVNPSNTVSGPFLVPPVATGVEFDVLGLSSYFKFNLDYMSFYHLVRLQDNGDNRSAYMILRNYTAPHRNAFFNMIDRALRGPDAARDAETRALLDQWIERPKRDFYVDVSSNVAVCGGEACQPVPVPLRPPATFLWEVYPFQLKGGGSGIIESAGVDYILPYWMARYYGVINGGSGIQSAAAPSSAIAPGSLASLYGQDLAAATAQAGSLPLPISLGGVTLAVTDSAGVQRNAPLLYVSPSQINFLVPENVAPGAATFAVAGGTVAQSFPAAVQPVAPTLFSMSGTGSGVAAALAVSVQAANPRLQSPVPVFQCGDVGCVSVPIALGVDQPVYVSFYGTGIRNRSSLANVTVTINGVSVPALYAGPAPNYAGLDQVNVGLPLALRGSGEVKVAFTVDGQTSNVVTINVR